MVTWDIAVAELYAGVVDFRSVYRYEIEVPKRISDLALVRRIKSAAGYSGIRGYTWTDIGAVEIRFPARCEIIIALARY